MELDMIKRGLRAEIKKREKETYATCQTNVRDMCTDVLSKLEEQEKEIAELEKENESLKNSVATLETDIAMAESWRTSTPPVGVELLLETGDGFWRVRFNDKEKVDYLVNEGTIKRWIPFPKTIG